jgi:hypothetical protein
MNKSCWHQQNKVRSILDRQWKMNEARKNSHHPSPKNKRDYLNTTVTM